MDIQTQKSVTPKVDVLNSILLHERGLMKNPSYKFVITDSKVNQMSHSIRYSPSRQGIQVPLCQFLRTSAYGTIIGVLFNNPNEPDCHSDIIEISFYDDSACCTGQNKSFLSKSLTHGTLCNYPQKLVDMVDTTFEKKVALLSVANCKNRYNLAILDIFEGNFLEWRIKDTLYCCACCKDLQKFAVGCEGGYYVFNTEHMDQKKVTTDTVLSLEFNDNGDLLYISEAEKGIQIYDNREPIKSNGPYPLRNKCVPAKENALNESSLTATKMNLLSDQVSLVVSDLEGDLWKIDTRMQRTVFKYEEHVAFKNNRPLSLNEDLDLISAVGKDNTIRIWSLSSGKLHCSRSASFWNVTTQRQIPQCCIVAEQRQWCLAVMESYNITIITSEVEDIEV